MKSAFLRGSLLFATAALAGCAAGTAGGGGGGYETEATRFHLGQQIARGQIAVEAVDPAQTSSMEFRTYADIIGRQLTRLGWTVVPAGGRSEQVAVVTVQRNVTQQARRSPVSVGVGGGTGGWRSGVGAGVSFGLGGGAKEVVTTMLEVRIKRRSDGTVFWEGRANTRAPSNGPAGQPGAAVEKLAGALFQDFPGESGRTIRVR